MLVPTPLRTTASRLRKLRWGQDRFLSRCRTPVGFNIYSVWLAALILEHPVAVEEPQTNDSSHAEGEQGRSNEYLLYGPGNQMV